MKILVRESVEKEGFGKIYIRYADSHNKKNIDIMTNEVVIPKNHIIEICIKRKYKKGKK